MKVSKIAQICKSRRVIWLVNEPDDGGRLTQWVGTHEAIYPLYGLRKMDKAQVYTIFDITEKQSDKIAYVETTADRVAFRLESHDITEAPIQPEFISINYGGTVYIPFNTSKGMRLVDLAYIKAMTTNIDLLNFGERQTASGSIYIVARVGLLIVGMVEPRYEAGGDKHLREFASAFADRMEYAQQVAYNETRGTEDKETAVQTMLFNEGTGELADDEPTNDGGDAA